MCGLWAVQVTLLTSGYTFNDTLSILTMKNNSRNKLFKSGAAETFFFDVSLVYEAVSTCHVVNYTEKNG